MGNGEWGRSYQCPMPYALCPKRRGGYEGMEFPAAFNELCTGRKLLR
ncbi:MAG: hypothetical protein V7L05_28730 [Nostoc sp.]